MYLIDPWANHSRWRERPTEVLLLSAGLVLLTLLLPPLPCAVVILLLSAVAVLAGAGIPLGVYLRTMAVPMSFLVMGAATLALSVSISPQGRLCLAVTPDTLTHAGLVFLRSMAAVSSMMLLALAVPMGEILSLLRRWRAPAVLVELMALVYRLLFVFDKTLSAMMRAQACRLGYRNLRTSYRSLGAVVAALFIRVIDRARRLERGLAARGDQGELRVLACRHPISRGAIGLILLIHLALVWLGLFFGGGDAWPN